MATIYKDSYYLLRPITGCGQQFKEEKSAADNNSTYTYVDGIVSTPYGYAIVYSGHYKSPQNKVTQSSCIEIIKNKKIHYRRFNKFYTQKTLVTKAKRFAKEIFN